jgi:hypothetical protein
VFELSHHFQHPAPEATLESSEMLEDDVIVFFRTLRHRTVAGVERRDCYAAPRRGDRSASRYQEPYFQSGIARNATTTHSRRVNGASGLLRFARCEKVRRKYMRFGVFDHLGDSSRPLAQHFEERLRLVEAYDRAGFYGYHLARTS